MTRVQVKKELLRNVGNAKQCVLCGRVFSRESGAVDHVFTEHSDLYRARPEGVGEQPSPATPHNALPAPPVAETRPHPPQPSGTRWMEMQILCRDFQEQGRNNSAFEGNSRNSQVDGKGAQHKKSVEKL